MAFFACEKKNKATKYVGFANEQHPICWQIVGVSDLLNEIIVSPLIKNACRAMVPHCVLSRQIQPPNFDGPPWLPIVYLGY